MRAFARSSRSEAAGLAFAAVFAIALPFAAAPPAAAKHPVGFADERPVNLEWAELERGATFRVCNGNRGSARLGVAFDGFGFTRAGKPVAGEGVLAIAGMPRTRVLGGGACRAWTLRTDTPDPIDPGRYSGLVSVVGGGAGIARARVTVSRPPSIAADTLAETHVRLDRDEYGEMRIERTIRVQMPRATPGLRRLLLARKRTFDEEHAANELLRRLGLSHMYYSYYGPPMGLALDEERAVLTFSEPYTLFSLDSLSLEGDLPAGGGGMDVAEVGDGLRLRLVGPDAEAGIAWEASVQVPAHLQRRFSPPPVLRRGDLLRWSFPAGSRNAAATVRFDLDEDARRTLLLGNRVPQALKALSFFPGEALFLGLLLLLCRKTPEAVQERARLRLVAWAGIAIFAATSSVWAIEIFTDVGLLRGPGEAFVGQAAGSFAVLAIPLLGVGFLVSVGRDPDRRFDGRAWLWTSAALAVAAISTFVTASRTRDVPYPGALEEHALRWLLASSGPLLVFMFVLLVLGASVMIVRWSWPEGRLREGARKIPLWLVRGGLVALAALSAVQWAGAVKARYEDRPPFVANGKAAAWWDALSTDVRLIPLGLLGRLAPLLSLLAVAAALPLLRTLGAGGVSETSFGKRDPKTWFMIVLFAGIVVGNGGTLEGFRIPLAFVLAIAFLYVLLRKKPGEEGAAALSLEDRRDLTTEALRYEQYRRRQSALYGKLAAGELALHDYRAQSDALQKPSEDTDPLSRGPFDDWWGNATAAARLGAYLSLAPLAYYVAVIVAGRIDDDLSSTAEFGLLDLLVGLTAEAATWVVAAFVLGGLYAHLPKRQGPVKGALLALVFAASVGLSAAILPGGGSTWTFRALETFLFLSTLGFLIDRQTIEEQGFYWRELFDVYRLRELRFAAGYLTTLSVALLAVFQQVLSGEAQQAITALFEAAGAAVPDPGS